MAATKLIVVMMFITKQGVELHGGSHLCPGVPSPFETALRLEQRADRTFSGARSGSSARVERATGRYCHFSWQGASQPLSLGGQRTRGVLGLAPTSASRRQLWPERPEIGGRTHPRHTFHASRHTVHPMLTTSSQKHNKSAPCR